MTRCTIALLALFAVMIQARPAHAELSPAEKAAGWRMLFDGESWEGWRSYRRTAPPTRGWTIENGELRVIPRGGGGDIITDETFGDFELSLEFWVAEAANSGIMYRVSETLDYPWQTGQEYQILDDANSPENKYPSHTVGSVYDLYIADTNKPTKPAGEWNTARIRVSRGIVKHFLNGAKVAQYDLDSADWKGRIAASKFRGYEGFGTQPHGHIVLQDHGDDVRYRNIKIRDLDEPMPGETALFNGRNTKGWTTVVPGDAEPVFSVTDEGTLRCVGNPVGYIRTDESYDNFVLSLRWRYTARPGNSGVLFRTIGPDKVWPNCLEAQLHAGQAGDFVNLSDGSMTMPRTEGIFGRKSHNAENPLSEWNEYEIIADGGEITLFVNGEKLNHATDCPTRPGTIALQSEGVPIEFRDIRLAPID